MNSWKNNIRVKTGTGILAWIEDHDLDEVNHFHAFHKTYTWQTEQSGAVGRMLATGMDALWDSLAEDAGNSSGS